MSLRLKLLLVALSTLALPWAGWQFVKQTEALLRQGQEQALLASAGMLAKALEARRVEPPPAGPVLYVQRADEPIAVDGYADDWAALRRTRRRSVRPVTRRSCARCWRGRAATCTCWWRCATRRAHAPTRAIRACRSATTST